MYIAIHAISITQVGNALGANLPSNAHLSATVAPFLAFLVSAIISLSLFFVQTPWVKLFTDDREVITLLRGIFPVLVVYTVADGVQSALTGILKGLGKQKIAGPIVIFSYYIVGLPFSVFLAFHISGIGADLDLFGLVVGTVIGTYTHMLLFAIVVYRTDWKYEAYYVHGKSKLVVLYTEVSHQLAMARKKMIGQISSSIMFTSTGDSENNDDFDYQDRFAATVSLLHSSHDGAEYKSLGQTVNNEHDSDSGNNNTTSSMGISSISDRKQLVSSSISTSSNTNNNEYLHRGKDLLEHGIDYHTLRYAEDEKLSDEVGITNPLHRERILVAQQHTVNEIDSKDDCGYSDINTSIPGHNLIPASNHPYINTSSSTGSSKQVSVIIDDEALSSKMTYFQLRQLEQRQVELRREIDQDNDNDLWALLMDSLGIYEVIVYLRYRLHGQSASEYHHTTGRGSSSSGGTGYDYAFDPSAGDESNQEPGSLYRLSRVSSRVKPLVAGLERSNSSKSSSVSQGSTELRALQQEHSSYIVRAAQYALSGLTTLVQGSRGTGRTEYELVRNYTDTFTLQDMEDDDENNDTNNNDYEDESK